MKQFFSDIELECQVAPIDYWRGMRGAGYRRGFMMSFLAYSLPGSYMIEWLATNKKTARVSLRCKKE